MGVNINLVIAGVGGQGTLLASRVLGQVALDMDYDVKVSEIHGMSQRGGSVVTYVRYSENGVDSPIIDEGGADAVLAFELLEGYRTLPYLKKGGKIIINTMQINPMPVITGAEVYPENIVEKIKTAAPDAEVITFDAAAAANQAGNSKAVNVALLGVFAKISGIGKEVWLEALKETVPPKFLEANLKAFMLGFGELYNED